MVRLRRILGNLLDHTFDALPFMLLIAVLASHGVPTVITF